MTEDAKAACGACGTKGAELVELEGAGYCAECVEAMAEHAKDAAPPGPGAPGTMTISLNGAELGERVGELLAEALAEAARAERDAEPKDTCAECGAKGLEVLVLDGAAYCEECTKSMREHADAEMGAKDRVPFPAAALAELNA